MVAFHGCFATETGNNAAMVLFLDSAPYRFKYLTTFVDIRKVMSCCSASAAKMAIGQDYLQYLFSLILIEKLVIVSFNLSV